jgi:KDO2-lipid IV(A) lauroyltransferase
MGNRILYYTVILPLSIMPYWYLYGLSNVTFLVIFHLIGYRKKVVYTNLKNSFPNKSKKEIETIARGFYKHLCDLIVESIKHFTVSEKQVRKRMKIVNPEVINKFHDEGRSVLLVGGHFNNWEIFALAIDSQIKHETIAIYKTLRNEFWDGKMRGSRERYGLSMISTKKIKAVFDEKVSTLTATIFATDQSPANAKKAYWTTFLNQDTAVLFGTEIYAKRYDSPVLYGHLRKVKRGHFTLEFTVLHDDPANAEEGLITELHTRKLEEVILEDPQYWLWSHKRWKRKRSELDE